MNSAYELPIESFKFQLIKERFTASSPLQYLVDFKFYARYSTGQTSDFTEAVSVHVSSQKFLLFEATRQALQDETHEAIEGALSHLPQWAVWGRELMEFAWKETWRGVRSKPLCGYKALHLAFLIIVGLVDPLQGIEHDLIRVVPAEDSSIQSLDGSCQTGCGTSCCICLEGFCSRGGGVRMPCSHAFHGRCIRKWLATSRYCPLCRSEFRPPRADRFRQFHLDRSSS